MNTYRIYFYHHKAKWIWINVLMTQAFSTLSHVHYLTAWHRVDTWNRPVNSTKHRVQNQLASNRAFSQFVSSLPSHLFVFLSRSLSLPLVSSSVGQSVCSEVFINTACLPSHRRDKWLFKILCSFPSSHIHLRPPSTKLLLLFQNRCQLPIPYFLTLTFLLFLSSYHFLLPLFPLCSWPSSPFPPPPAGHLVATVPSSRGSWTNTGTRDLVGPWTTQWKWASHWETWFSLQCSHNLTQAHTETLLLTHFY